MKVVIAGVGELVRLPIGHTVSAACGERVGVWCCITHAQYLETDAEQREHLAKGHGHTLAYVCSRHGVPEVPPDGLQPVG